MATIDLSLLPAPTVVDPLDYESLLADRKATLISLYPEEQREAIARTLTLESEPIVKLLQENAYRELLLRQRVNEAAQAVMLGYASGSDLDQLGANFRCYAWWCNSRMTASSRRCRRSWNRIAISVCASSRHSKV